jgi:DNA-binding YbaB/EbfC family protein
MNANFENLMKEAEKMQQRMKDAQEQLGQLTVIGKSGGDMVLVKMNGRHDVLEVKIKPTLMEEDIDMLQDLIAAATNDAVRKIEAELQKKVKELTAGLNIPTTLEGGEGGDTRGG